jgi:hypothetical protein
VPFFQEPPLLSPRSFLVLVSVTNEDEQNRD